METKLIEKTFPVEHLNRVAMAEGNAKKPIYKMHKWWARRLGSVFRAIVLSAFSSAEGSDEDLWTRFCDGADLGGLIVLDPFMGGGTTIVEALRVGCRVIGVDVNPVAWFVTKKEVEPVDLAKLDEAFLGLQQTAGSFIKRYYRTTCPVGHDADVMYFFWVKVASCPRCGKRVSLFPNYELSRRDSVNVAICPRCLQVVESRDTSHARCGECGVAFDPRSGLSGRGKFTCPDCGGQHSILKAVDENGGPLEVLLHAIEGYCSSCGRFFKRVDPGDLANWREAEKQYQKESGDLLIPQQKIPTEGRSDPRPVNHGYKYFRDMFNKRQLLCLSHLLQEILKIEEVNIRELMLVAFSDCLDSNNMFCKYETQWHKISLFFGLHAYHPIERPTENNVWGTRFGRCTFVKCFEKVRRAKVYCEGPYERLATYQGRRVSKRTGRERIRAKLVGGFSQLSEQNGLRAILRCGSSEHLEFVPDKSIDAVITDPPYFDNVQYSELADFFYVWLRLALRGLYPWFEPQLSTRSEEIVQNEKMSKTAALFSEALKRVFIECHRVLKDDGLFVFTFHHNKLWAWEKIGTVLLEAGFYVSATPIVRSEGKSGFHSSAGNIRYDCVLVCRKRTHGNSRARWAIVKQRIVHDSILWARRTLESRMALGHVDVFTIIMGKTIEHFSKSLVGPSQTESKISLASALKQMEQFAAHAAQSAAAGTPRLPSSYERSAQQLTLFVEQSRSRYAEHGRTGREAKRCS